MVEGFQLEAVQPLDAIANRNPVCLGPDADIGAAARTMAGRAISSVLICDAGQHPLGIITERDVLRALCEGCPPQASVAGLMSAPVFTLPGSMPWPDAYQICVRRGIRHLAVLDGDGRAIGILSETDFRDAFSGGVHPVRRPVTAVMSTAVVARPADTALDEALSQLQGHRDGCVVVVEDDRPVGILTERDLVRLYSTGALRAGTRLAEVMTAPVLTMALDALLEDASRLMAEHRLRHLVIVDATGRLVGLLDEHDLAGALASERADRQIDAERRLLRTLIDTIPDLVWLKDPEGRYLACNHRFESLYGAPERAIQGRTDRDFVDPATAAMFRANDLAAVAEDTALRNEERLRFADGHEERCETIKTPMRDGDGRLIGVLGVARDLTALHQAREALAEREALFRAVFDQSAFGIALTDPESLRFVEANGAACDMLGYSREALLELGLPEVQAEMSEAVIRQRIAHIIEAGGAHFETRHRDRHGAVMDVEVRVRPLVLAERRLMLAIWHDIGERKALQRRLEDSERRLRTLIDGTPDIICFKDGAGRWLHANRADLELFGLTHVDYVGKTDAELAQLTHPIYRDAFLTCKATDERAWQAGGVSRGDERIPLPGGGERVYEVIKTPIFDNGRRAGLVVLGRDVTERKRAEDDLTRIAHFDMLTGVPNRVLLAERMAGAIESARRDGTTVAVCYLDLDGFKPINDRFGHAVGDRLLQEVARRLAAVIGPDDTLARLGGDEFVILLGGLPSDTDCQALHRVLAALARPVFIDHAHLSVSASIGVTLFPEDDADPDTLLRHADQAMYQAKEAGKNRCHRFDAGQDHVRRDRQRRLARLEQAFARGEMRLLYQPKVDLVTGAVVGAEALVRWEHPEEGLLTPALFLDTLKNTRLEGVLGEWVIEQALAQVERWGRLGLQLPVSVNISANHLQEPRFAERLRAILAAHPGCPPEALELEVLESAAIEDLDGAAATLAACKALGVHASLDDFGTGYSSLAFFRRLPLEGVKIDVTFVRNMLEDPEDLGIVSSVIELARAFNRRVVAEGVETLEHGAALLSLGCRFGQGFGISPPLAPEEMPDWVGVWRAGGAWKRIGLPSGVRQDVGLVVAEDSHRHWVEAVASRVRGECAPPGPELATRDCRFGRWYAGGGFAAYGHLPGYAALDAEHEAIHALARELLGLADGGRRSEALARLPDLYHARDRFLSRLRGLADERRAHDVGYAQRAADT